MSDKSQIQQHSKNVPFNNPENVVASVSKDAFRAMFYLFAGRPDSKTKLFKRKIVVTPEEIYDLNEQVIEKLKLHSIDQIVATATLKIDKHDIMQFGTWAEFEHYNWKVADTTQEISVKWDFMIKLAEYAVAQRHTLTVKITGMPNPRDFLQLLFSNDSEEDDFDGKMGVCVARVDFISHRLADELLEVVSKWNASLITPKISTSWFNELEKFDSFVASFIHLSVPCCFALLAYFGIEKFLPLSNDVLSPKHLIAGLRWLLVSSLVIYALSVVSKHLAQKCYTAINEFGSFTPFNLTNGDKNTAIEMQEKNKSKIKSFIINACLSLILDLIAGLALWYVLPTSK